MTYAIIQTGGKQFWVEPGRFYDVELLHQEPDSQVDLEDVLLINHEGTITLGHPYIEGATVRGRVLSERRARKVIVYKMRPKKKTRKKNGHRQNLTRLMIESISWSGMTVEAPASAGVSQMVSTETAATNPNDEQDTPMTAETTAATATSDHQEE